MPTTTTGVATSFIDFTRASNATVTDSDGKVKWAPHNLLLNSESFDAAAWTKYLAPITSNAQVAPNGTTTADTVTTSDNYSSVNQTLAVLTGATYTLAFYAKRGTMTDAKLSVRDVNNAADIVAATSYYSATNSSTWSLVTQSFTVPAGCTTITVHVLKESFAAGTIHLWGAALYRSDLAMQPNTSAYPMYNPTTPKNLLGYTEDLGFASVWAPTRSTVATSAVTAPNGILNARTITATSGTSGTHYVRQVMTLANSLHVLSVYAKVGTRSWLLVNNASVANSSAYFDLSNGTTGTVGAAATASVTSIGDGWYRCSILFTAAAGSNELRIAVATADATASFTSDGTETINLWGAQLSDSASLDSYSPVYGAAVTSAAYYGPRRDFDSAGVCKGLLVEEQRTNFFISSNLPAAGTGTTITASAATSPDGTTNAYRIAKTDATTPRYVSRNTTSMTTVANRTYTVSAWFKYDGFNTTVSLEYNDSANWDLSWNAQFTVANTGVTVLSAAGCTQSVQNVGNGWYRAIVTFTAGPAPTITSNPVVLTRITGASGVTVLGYGGQIEENAAFPTSYIPTNGAPATRNADVASVSTQAFPYSATEGTVVANYSTILPVSTSRIVAFGPTSYATYLDISTSSSVASWSGSVNLVTASGASTVGPVKSGLAHSGTGRSLVHAGGTAVTDANTFPPNNALYLGSSYTANTYVLNGHIRQITYLPRRLSNVDLQARTA